MPIQFLCASCRHPIEIDDEWANKTVACPFCRNTVVAPAESTYEPPAVVPTARTVEPSAAGTCGDSTAAQHGNLVAVWAFGCACLSLLAFFIFSAVIMSRVLEDVGPDVTPEQFQNYFYKQIEAGQTPKWLGAALLAFFLAAVLWVVGLVCAIVALRVRTKRGFTYAALGLLAIVPLWIVVGVVGGPS